MDKVDVIIRPAQIDPEALYTVETEDALYVGTITQAPNGDLTIRDGSRGRPVVVLSQDVHEVLAADLNNPHVASVSA